MEHAYVFVYGTLRRGGGNHAYLEHSDCLGEGLTVERYAMYAQGIPYVTDQEQVSQIVGEVYNLDPVTLERVDRLEGHPDWYQRRPVTIRLRQSQEPVQAWVYFNPRPKGRLVASGDYLVNRDWSDAELHFKKL